MKKKIYYILLIPFSLFFIIIIFEIFVRIFIDTGFNYELEMLKYSAKLKEIHILNDNQKVLLHKKNKYQKLMRADIYTDKYGFRFNPKINLNNKKIKVLMLGDSMTMGWGAKETFSDYINKMQNSEFAVYNSGVGNTNTIMQISSFFSYFKNINPEIVILNFFINDLEDIKLNNKNFFLKNFYSYSFIKYRIYLLKLNYQKNKIYENYYKETFKNKEIINKTFLLIKNLNNYCLNKNIKLIINFIPELRDLKNYKFSNEYNFIKEFLKSNNIEFIDSIDTLKEYAGKENKLWVSKEDTHGNNSFHESVAQFIFLKLKKL